VKKAVLDLRKAMQAANMFPTDEQIAAAKAGQPIPPAPAPSAADLVAAADAAAPKAAPPSAAQQAAAETPQAANGTPSGSLTESALKTTAPSKPKTENVGLILAIGAAALAATAIALFVLKKNR
jgi:hypothetical protein